MDEWETCDDGNTTSGDCCSSTCQSEGCCGNGLPNPGEQCDDGNVANGDCCSSTCQLEGCTCGNGFVNAGEECDDGNLLAGDCCSPGCEIESACSEHYKVYKSKTAKGTAKFSPQQISLEDAFGGRTLTVSKPDSLGNPVDQEGEGIVDATLHLECYKTKDVSGVQSIPPQLTVRNQFAVHYLTLKKAASLCFPTAMNGIATSLGADRFRCYKAKGTPIGSTVTLADPFETKETVVASPVLFCNPAQQTLTMVQQPARRLLCYKIKDAKLDPKQPKLAAQTVTTQNSVGNESLTATKAALLCVPSFL